MIRLRNQSGHEHIVQIWLGLEACPACGQGHAKGNLGELDHKAMVASVISELEKSESEILDYARRHNLKIK